MRRIILYMILGILGTIGLSSCSEDFLNISPETSIASTSFYKTPDQFDQALIASYEKLRSVALQGTFMDEMRSDNTFYTLYSGDRGPYLRIEVIALFLDDAATGYALNDRYNDCYSGISRVNAILDRLPKSQLTEAERQAVKAEALFLRAFYYYDLVQHYGPVPLMLREITSTEGAFAPNNTVDEIYAQILLDVSESITIGLPIAETFPQSGRASMGAAKMLRAYTNMSKPTRDYAAAEKDLIDITKMNYGLLANYADVFALANKNSKESIFEVQFLDGDGGQENTIPWRMIPKCSNNDFLMGVQASNTVNISGGWNVPTEEMIKSYESGDKRLSASIGVVEGVIKSEIIEATAVKDIVGYTPTAGKDYRIFVRKYYHPPYSYASKAGDNFPVYRYSGALLLLAECLVAEGKNADALPYINLVRVRAGLPPLTQVTADNVASEMRHELAFENHRWTDLIRTGKAIEVMTEFGKQMKAIYGWILPQAFNVTQDKLVYPFYFRELQVNKNLKQNPGY